AYNDDIDIERCGAHDGASISNAMRAMNRRDFLHTGAIAAGTAALPRVEAGAIGASTAAPPRAQARAVNAGTAALPQTRAEPRPSQPSPPPTSAPDTRAAWIALLTRLADPVLTHLAQGTLKAQMPCEATPGAEAARRKFTHLEAFGRLLTGMAPWLE